MALPFCTGFSRLEVPEQALNEIPLGLGFGCEDNLLNFLVMSSCLNLLALQSMLNEPITEGSFYWMESKLQEGSLLSGSFELCARSPRGE